MKAAHPQRAASDPQEQPASEPAASGAELAKMNPLPTHMMVIGADGDQLRVDLAWSEGKLFAPGLNELRVSPDVRQYITQFCAMWTQSLVTSDKVRTRWPDAPRRGQLVFHESQLHAMLGLADDEALVRVVADPLQQLVRFVIESPRLAPQQWDQEPPVIGLPVSAWYEGRRGDGDSGGVEAAQRQLDALEARSETSQREWAEAIHAARMRVEAMRAREGGGS